MPLYDILCLARPNLNSPQLFNLIKGTCSTVLDGKGVITKITYNGPTTLAHVIKKTHGHYPEVCSRGTDMYTMGRACMDRLSLSM